MTAFVAREITFSPYDTDDNPGDQTRFIENANSPLDDFIDVNNSLDDFVQNPIDSDHHTNIDILDQSQNISQFSSFISNNDDEENNNCDIAYKIYKANKNYDLNNNSEICDIISYYKPLVLNKYPTASKTDLKHVLKIIVTFFDICCDHNIVELELSEENIVHKSIYSIVGQGYDIIKKSENLTLAVLTQQEKYILGSAAKRYNCDMKKERKRSSTNKTRETEIPFVEKQVKGARNNYKIKPEILLNSPEIIKPGSALFAPIINPDENSTSINNDLDEIAIIRDFSNIPENLDLGQIHYDILYYTTNIPIMNLSWDGSHIGNFDKCQFQIVKTQQTLGNKFMLININGQQFWSEYIKISDKYNSSLISTIDEWKPLFGLEKIGTHCIVLNNVKYILFKPLHISKIFKINKKLSDFNPIMIKGEYLNQIRNILLFKYLIGGSFRSSNGKNIIRFDPENLNFISFSDLTSRESYGSFDLPKCVINKWLTDRLVDGNLDRDQHFTILSNQLNKVLNIRTLEDKEIVPSILRSKMTDIGRRINSKGESNYSISFIISRVQHLVDFY